jgi:hypothetical protein
LHELLDVGGDAFADFAVGDDGAVDACGPFVEVSGLFVETSAGGTSLVCAKSAEAAKTRKRKIFFIRAALCTNGLRCATAVISGF